MTIPKTTIKLTKFEKLCVGILANSSDPNIHFTKAKDEWELLFVLKNPGGQCLCSKNITNECHIENQVTKKTVIVGSDCLTRVCIKGKYINEVTNLFTAINIFLKDKKLERLLIEYCKEKVIINKWEYEFSLSTYYKKNLSDKQKTRKEVIDTKILKAISKEKLVEPTSSKPLFEKPKIKLIQ